MIYVVALNHDQFDYWCRFVADPPINPNDQKKVTCLSTSADSSIRKLMGRQLNQDDAVITYGQHYMGRYYPMVMEELRIRAARAGVDMDKILK